MVASTRGVTGGDWIIGHLTVTEAGSFTAMSQQHSSFPSHLPRGVAASALTLPRAAAPTLLRSGVSPTIQIPSFSSVPPAPSVPTVSGSVTGLPSSLVRNPAVISAIRTGIQPASTAVTGSVSLTDHQRTSLIVQGPAGAGTAIQGPLQITLTQRVPTGAPTLGMSLNPSAPTAIGMSEAMKLAPLGGGKPVQVAQAAGLALPTQKVSLSAHQAGSATSVTPGGGVGLVPAQIQHQAVLVASKAGGLQVSASVPAISISPMSVPMSAPTVMTSVSSPHVPIAKVPPQRQQQQQVTLTPGLTVQMVTTSAAEMGQVSNLGAAMATTQAASGQLLQLSQPTGQRTGGASIIATSTPSSSSASSGAILPQPGDRLAAPTVLNLAAAAAAAAASPGQGQGQDAWLSQFIYPQSRTQLVSAPNNPPQATALPSRLPTAAAVTNTFFVPRPGAELGKMVNNPTPTLTASLSQHQAPSHQPTVLFNAHHGMVVEGLRPSQQQQPPLVVSASTGGAAIGVTIAAMVSSAVTLTTADSKPVSSTPGLHQSLMVAGGANSHMVRASDASQFTSNAGVPGQSTATLIPGGSTNLPGVLTSGGATMGNNASHHHPHHHHLSQASHLSSRATVASSLLTMVSTHQSHPMGVTSPASAALVSSQQGAPLSSNSLGGAGGMGNSASATSASASSSSTTTGASPRPSILRKRNIDGVLVTPKKPNFSSMLAESHSPRPDSVLPSGISSPKTPATENSQSSTDTALSSNDGGTPTQNGDRVKTELMDASESGPAAGSSAVTPLGTGMEASPRKRARKQLFDLSRRKMNEDKASSSTEDEEDNIDEDTKLMEMDIKEEDSFEERDEFIDEEGIRWTKERTKPTMSLMSENIYDYKPRFNHFQRYSDVKSKDDRNPTLNELISQRGIVQKASGWKLYYVSTQVEEVMENEEDLEQRLEKLKERLDVEASTRPSNEQDFHRLLELARGNLQRCKVVRQQLQEAQANMLNLLKHEPKVREIITKNLAKRTIKKKERCWRR